MIERKKDRFVEGSQKRDRDDEYFIIIIYDIETKKQNGKRKILYIDGGENNDVENKTGIFYNDTVKQFLKGM